MICDYRVSKGDFTHVISSCPHCHRDEIMDVRTDERQSFDHKIGEQSDI
jgi:glutaredoxin